MVFVSSPAALNPELGDPGPLAVYAQDRRADPLHISYVALKYEPDQPRVMARQTLGLAHAMADILLFYLLQEHPSTEAEINRILHDRASMLMLP
jgi:hypothetical protein